MVEDVKGRGGSGNVVGKDKRVLENWFDRKQQEVLSVDESGLVCAESIAEVYRDIYDEAVKTNTLGSLETVQRIVARLGEEGYVAVDRENQIDMAGAEQVAAFCEAVSKK